jgi:hypothetical protein
MAAVARDLDNILIHRVATVVAAVFRITRHGTAACFVFALVFVCHKNQPP